jgi:hypothetical protein
MLNAVNTYNVSEFDFHLNCPKECKPLCIKVIDGQAKMYMAVDNMSFATSRRFVVVSEHRNSVDNLANCTYVDSFKPRDGAPMHHVFDATPQPGPLEQLAACGDVR